MSSRSRSHSLRLGFMAVAVAGLLAGCAATPSTDSTIERGTDTVVIDVRTASEYASGHLEGAVNIDFQSPEFASRISDLDEELDYIVYCQSGNRSARAVAEMTDEGLSVQDAGGVDQAAQATDLEIVR